MTISNTLIHALLMVFTLISITTKSAHEITESFAEDQNNLYAYNPNISLIYAICFIPTICDRAHEVSKAILAGANLEAIIPNDETGTTALMHSALHARFQITAQLLSFGANPNTTSTNGTTPLMCATLTQHINAPEIVNMLLRHKANVNAQTNSKNTALHYAVLCGNTEIIRLLIKHKADANVVNSDGITPLKIAKNHNLDLIEELLIFAGAQPVLDNQKAAAPVPEQEQKNETPLITPQAKACTHYLSLPSKPHKTEQPKSRHRARRRHRYNYRHNRIDTLKKIADPIID